MIAVPSSPLNRRAAVVARRSLLRLALLAAVPIPALAAPADPTVPIKALYAGLEKLMRQGSETPFGARFQEIAPVIDHTFDLSAILARAVGARWSSLDDAARTQLFKAFRDFTVATYVANFDQYDGQKFEVLPQNRAVGADLVVATQIIRANGSPVRIDYVMRQGSPNWQAVDVLLDGSISRVAVLRSDFRSLLEKGGAPALMASLQRKTADLSGGAKLGS